MTLYTSEHEEQEEQTSRARKITGRFLVAPDCDALLSSYQEVLARRGEPYDVIGQAFQSNVRGLVATVSIPCTLASVATTERHFQRLHLAERIRSRNLEATDDESRDDLELRREATAHAKARLSMDAFTASSEGHEVLIRDTMSFLEHLLGDDPLARAVDELLRQGLVLCWGAFEVLARDIFIALLNMKPYLVERLLRDQTAKRRFEAAKVSIDTLILHGFDLSNKMGTLLADQQDLSDYYSIKAIYEALYPEDITLRQVLKQDSLRALSQRRNLIVHRGGIIDIVYIKNVPCTQKSGEILKITPDNLEKHLETMISAATVILETTV